MGCRRGNGGGGGSGPKGSVKQKDCGSEKQNPLSEGGGPGGVGGGRGENAERGVA